MRRLLLLALLMLPGCAKRAAEPEAAAPEPAPAEAPSPVAAEAADDAHGPATLEEAEAALAQAQSELDAALGPLAFAAPPSAVDQSSGSPPPPAAAPKAGAPAEEAPAESRRAESESSRARAASKKEASDCALACRAFQSLNRAVDAVCRLDSGGERCARARRVASDAQTRVASCSCPAP
jgi:hypothetical protein